jgi:hypothetical protein
MKKVINTSRILLIVAFILPMFGHAQMDTVSVKKAITNWNLDASTVQIDPTDRSKYLPGAQYEAVVNLNLSSLTNVDSVLVLMSSEDGSEEYFTITLPLNGSLNTANIYLEVASGNNSVVVHAGKYSKISNYVVKAQLIFTDGTKGLLSSWN